MDNQAEKDIVKANTEIASVVAQWRIEKARQSSGRGHSPAQLNDKGSTITNPAGFWATALASTGVSQMEIEYSLRLTAAKLRAGDSSFVVESAVGQVAWLSTLVLELKEDADRQPVGSTARMRLLELSMRAQNAAAKLALSLGLIIKGHI